ncbi:hypothetical protein TWF694_002859 [Orbilia ellipsospora]|uniref:Mitochondrial division protein 1 n=1 Tax=Orbilia ellipsospora TaxID=2528407 RepID=A0AAV9X5Y3_9PEZI
MDRNLKRPASQELVAVAENNRLAQKSHAVFSGVGLQHSGAGNISVARDLVIGGLGDLEKDSRCLNDLRVTDPRHDKQRIESVKGGLLADAYTWVLSNTTFKQWHSNEDDEDDDRSRLLWVKGDPGKGKTMLLCGIIDELKKSTSAGNFKYNNVAFFFCQATDERLNNAAAVLRGLIFLLVNEQPALLSHVRKRYDIAGEKLFQDNNAWFALAETFTDLIQDPGLKSTCLVIDALDECTIDLPKLLDLIVQSLSRTSNSRLRWIVSSRNWPNIENVLNTATQSINLSLELNAESISAAVAIYINSKIDKLGYNSKLRDIVHQYLSSNAQNTFLWVALVCQELENVPKLRVKQKLHEFPPGLDTLYRRMLDQIHNHDDCKSIVAFMLVVRRPITLEELAILVDFPDIELDDLESLREIVELCGSFLTVRDDTISFIHQSAKDYLVKSASTQVFPDGRIEKQEQLIALRSIDAMEKTLQKNIYGLESLDFTYSKDKFETPDPDPLASVRYVCIHWIDHLCETEGSCHETLLFNNGRIHNFLQKRMLHWLEALSLLKAIPSGVQAMAKLSLLLTKAIPAKAQISCLVYDANRFILHNRLIIERFPRQIYVSALLFSPVQSLTRKLFETENLDWVAKPTIETDWGPCIQTFYGHSEGILSVTCSNNGACIASGSYDGTIKIWDFDGNCLNTSLRLPAPVNSVVFSKDDAHIVSGSDMSIRIWHINSGCLNTLYCHDDTITSVAYSNDSTLIASSSSDGEIKIWNLNGNCLNTFHGHNYLTTSVVFSNDNTHIASSSEDSTVKIWDFDGNCLKTLRGHIGRINSVIFSKDDAHIVSGADDEKIKIWDFSGICLKTLQGHTGPVTSATSSNNNKTIASGSEDNTIKIWDFDGNCLKTLRGHIGRISSVVFSKDDGLIISGSGNGTIKIWDINNKICLDKPDRHNRSVTAVTFSKSSALVASGSDDKTIKIWDIDGNCFNTLHGHAGSIISVVFSNNGNYIASSSRDGTIKIWHINGSCLKTLTSNAWIRSMTFSNNDTLISGSSYETIKIWDLNGILLNTLSLDTWIDSIAFSNDGACIASSLSDGTIKIWHINSSHIVTLQCERRVSLLAFDNTNSHLSTDWGDIYFDADSGSGSDSILATIASTRESGHRLSTDKAWITSGDRNVVWVPEEHRPCLFSSRGDAIVFGHKFGYVTIFRFSPRPS